MADQICRDWLSTLWQASYKGTPFFFESDDEEGGRGLVIHEFPNRDAPYVEDLGEKPRYFEGHAYVHGEDADRSARALSEMFASRGAGMLVLPIRGPVTVQCLQFQRRHERDKLGYVAFHLKFVRDGAATALISIPSLVSLAFAAAGGLAGAIAATVTPALELLQQPDHVVAAAADGARDALVALEAVRTSEPVAPAASATLRDAIQATYDLVPSLINDAGAVEAANVDSLYAAIAPFDDRPTAADASTPATAGPYGVAFAITSLTRALADAIPADAAFRSMRVLAETYAVAPTPFYVAISQRVAADNARAIARAARLAALTAFAEAALRRTYRSRPEGVSARAELAERFENELNQAAGAEGVTLYRAIQDLRGRTVDYLSRAIADLAPVITIEALRSMPSLWWAWRLYADPLRAGELVDRNELVHPSFVPQTFQALAR